MALVPMAAFGPRVARFEGDAGRALQEVGVAHRAQDGARVVGQQDGGRATGDLLVQMLHDGLGVSDQTGVGLQAVGQGRGAAALLAGARRAAVRWRRSQERRMASAD
jgi:hypothetical protein